MKLFVNSLIALLIFIITSKADSQPITLPQSHDYQVTLRNYMSSLTVKDFEVGLKPLSHDFEYFRSMDDLFRTWILFRQAPPEGPIVDIKGLTVDPEYFTLRSIESSEGIMMGSDGNFPWISPEATVWWSNWNYPGNPYYKNKAIMRRALVFCIVDMLMHDEAHENGDFRRSDYLGATLIWMAYTYDKVKGILPVDVQNAYETGLLKFFERIEEWGPRGNAGDMDQFAHIGMWYTAKSIGDAELIERSKIHSEYILSKHLRPAGYIDHGDGFDPSYNGISLDLLGWAALATGYDFFADALDQMSLLKAHLTLPEPDGQYYGPSHFSTATSMDSPNDLRGLFKRDIGIAMVSDHAKYLIWEGRSGQNTGYKIPTQDEMLSRISLLTRRTNGKLERSNSSPKVWRQKNWTNGIIYAHEYYEKGFYDELSNLNREQSPLRRLPLNQEDDYIHKFPDNQEGVKEHHKDEFLTAKLGDFALIIHTGRLSYWGNEDQQSGFGGGALSAFWTRETGSVILGRTGGFQGPEPDTWENWRQWPTHAISGINKEGEAFSSARYRYPERKYDVNSVNARIVAYGAIGQDFDGGRTTEKARQGTQMYYSRDFDIEENGLTVTSTVSMGEDNISELYEMIPIFLGGKATNIDKANTTLTFWIGDVWIEPHEDIHQNVESIKIERHEGEVYINFASPQEVRLSPKIWEDRYQSDAKVRNIMINLLNPGIRGSEETSVRYTIKAG
ncbi:MAG: hypothetical protein WD267_14040 [Balneolales bacterium]